MSYFVSQNLCAVVRGKQSKLFIDGKLLEVLEASN